MNHIEPNRNFCAFNEYFGQVGSLLAQIFQDNSDPLPFLDNNGTIDDFNFVETIIEKMKSSSAGYDNVPICVFKLNFDFLGPFVTEICNTKKISHVILSVSTKLV